MNRLKKTIVTVTLIIFLPGCTAYRTMDWETAGPPGDPGRELALETGKRIRVTLKDGDRYSGKVTNWDDEILTLDTSLRRKLVKERTAAWGDIEAIEEKESNTNGSVAIGVVLLGVVALVVAAASVDVSFGGS